MTHSWGVLGGTSSTMTMNSIFPLDNSFPSAVLISAANRSTTKLVRAECVWSAYVMPYPNPLHRVAVHCVRWSCYSCHNRHRIHTCKQNVLIIANEVLCVIARERIMGENKTHLFSLSPRNFLLHQSTCSNYITALCCRGDSTLHHKLPKSLNFHIQWPGNESASNF